MMRSKILIVEDETPKCENIQAHLLKLNKNFQIFIAKSVTSALDYLEQNVPSVIILDMSLPTFDISKNEGGGRPQVLGGNEILRTMELMGINCPTILLTGYETFQRANGSTVTLSQIREELKKRFPKLIQNILYYTSIYDEWKSELNEELKKLELIK